MKKCDVSLFSRGGDTCPLNLNPSSNTVCIYIYIYIYIYICVCVCVSIGMLGCIWLDHITGISM